MKRLLHFLVGNIIQLQNYLFEGYFQNSYSTGNYSARSYETLKACRMTQPSDKIDDNKKIFLRRTWVTQILTEEMVIKQLAPVLLFGKEKRNMSYKPFIANCSCIIYILLTEMGRMHQKNLLLTIYRYSDFCSKYTIYIYFENFGKIYNILLSQKVDSISGYTWKNY